MRNFGIIFILVIIGLALWKASDRFQPVNSIAETSHNNSQAVEAAPPGTTEQRLVFEVFEEVAPQLEDPDQSDLPVEPLIAASSPSAVKPRQKIKSPVQIIKSFDQIVIPTLKINTSVVSKPYSELSWNLTTLGQDVAFLGNIPNQTSDNNIIMAGHVTVRNGSHGPFRYLLKLVPGDQVQLQDDNFTYIYVVREQVLVYPDETAVLEDSPTPQLTLITCTTWDEETLSYLRRRVVVADLVRVESMQVTLD